MKGYTVQQLATLAGVSVRTLHLYDEMGLLKPATRTEAGYRVYGEPELLRLQQILFYKELDVPLAEIRKILDDPSFDTVAALKAHKEALQARGDRISTLLETIDDTLTHLTQHTMTDYKKLYKGFPKGLEYRNEAIEKYGKDTVENSEKALLNLSKEEMEALTEEQTEVGEGLIALRDEDPTSAEVQALIARHYKIIERFWGRTPAPEAYKGLGQLYISDPRFARVDGEPNAAYAAFMAAAMAHYADSLTKQP